MRVLADRVALGHGRDHLTAEILGVRACKPDALDALDCVAGAEELAEVGLEVREEIPAPGVDVLAEQRHLADSFPGQLRDLGEDLARSATDLPPADLGDDAVRADRVTAHRDLHPGLEPPLAVRG